jgi:catechol 2,3-dioxygenase-like lactoylglutathione lyase family enzyme
MADYPLLNFDSLTIVVADLAAAVTDWTDKLGFAPDESDGLAARFALGGTWIELVGAANDEPTGVRRVVVGVDDLGPVVEHLRAAGAVVSENADGIALDPGDVNGVPLVLIQSGASTAPTPSSQWQRINHLVVAVRDDEDAKARWAELFGVWPPHPMPTGEAAHHVPVGVAWFGLTGTGTDAGALAKFVERRGEGIYAVGLVVDDQAATIADLRARDAGLIEAPTQTFVHPRTTHGLLVDIVGDLSWRGTPGWR